MRDLADPVEVPRVVRRRNQEREDVVDRLGAELLVQTTYELVDDARPGSGLPRGVRRTPEGGGAAVDRVVLATALL